MKSQQVKVLKKALDKYGENQQLIICAEECAELIQAISKLTRYKTPEKHYYMRKNLIEEMSDVIISLEYLRLVENVSLNELENVIEQKINRLDKNMKEE